MRRPHWADAVRAVDPTGAPLAVTEDGGWCAAAAPVTEVEFVFAGGVYAEDRRCTRLPDGPTEGKPFVLGHGPWIMAAEGRSPATPAWPATVEALRAQGIEPFPASLRGKDCTFVFGRGS